MSDQKFLDGMIVKSPHENAPDFVLGKISFKVDEVIQSLKDNSKNGWVNMDLKKSREGKLYASIDTWESDSQSTNQESKPKSDMSVPSDKNNDDDLPF